jgi:hypothetical protein
MREESGIFQGMKAGCGMLQEETMMPSNGSDKEGSVLAVWSAFHPENTADGLSRRPRTASNDIDEQYEGDIDDFIDAENNAFSVLGVGADGEPLLETGYFEESWSIAQYLASGLRRPAVLSQAQYRAFGRKALQYHVEDGKLYQGAGKNVPLRVVVDSEEERKEILESLHDEHGIEAERELAARSQADITGKRAMRIQKHMLLATRSVRSGNLSIQLGPARCGRR